MQFANLDWYMGQIVRIIKYYDKRFELRKETVYENGYKSKGLVLYVIQSKREETENTMQSFEILEIKDIKFISFKHTMSDDKVGVLHLNNMNNIKVRFETLYNTNVFD